MENVKLWIIDMPENLSGKEVTNNMKIWLKGIYEKLDDTSTVWLGFNYLYYKKVLELVKEAGFINHLDNWVISESENSERKDYFHLTKKDNGYTWNKVEFKREVVVPYKVDGKPRGWFEDSDGKPVRFTGVGNCIYSSKINNKYDFIDLIFILTSSNKGDIIDIQNFDSYFLARGLGRYIHNNDTLNDFDPGDSFREEIKKIVGDVI